MSTKNKWLIVSNAITKDEVLKMSDEDSLIVFLQSEIVYTKDFYNVSLFNIIYISYRYHFISYRYTHLDIKFLIIVNNFLNIERNRYIYS